MNYFCLTLIAAAFVWIECYAGGTRLIDSLPAYILLAIATLPVIFCAKASKIPARPACLVSSAFFFGYILLHCHLSPVVYLARPDFFMVLGSLTIYLLTALQIVKAKHRMQFLAVLLLIAVGEVAVGLVQFSRGNDFMLFGYNRSPNGSRASGQYISPNHLAGYLEVVAVMGTSLVFWSTLKPWAKILAAYASLAGFAGVVITGSRGGYVSTGFCVLAFCAFSIAVVKIAFPEHLVRVVVITGIFLVMISASLPVLITSDLIKQRAGTIVEKNMRLYLWQAAVAQVRLNPVFGTGSGTYLYYGRKFRPPEVQSDPVNVHNDYLELLAEYGFVGGIGFVIFLGTHLWSGFHSFGWIVTKRLQFSADWRSSSLALNIGCLCAVAAYMVHSVVDFNLHIPSNCMLMAFVFGILANPGLETFQTTGPAMAINRVFKFLMPVLGITILATGTPKLPGEFYAEKARVALRDKKYYEAISAAKQGIKWEKKNPDLFYYVGEAWRNIGYGVAAPANRSFFLLASNAFQQGLEQFPEDVRLLLAEGWTLDGLGQFDESEKYFDQAVEWDPNWEQVQESYKTHLEFRKASEKVLLDQE